MKTFPKLIAIALLSLGSTIAANAQQGFGTSTPDKSTIIDMVNPTPSANAKGVLMPRVTLTSLVDVNTISNPVNSLTVFNTATTTTGTNDVSPGYYYYSKDLVTPANSKWVRFATANDQDLRLLPDGYWNHLTQDAGQGGNGTSVGSGQGNIGIGKNTLLSTAFGDINVAIGYDSQKSSGDGSANISVGAYTLLNLASGNNNTAIGSSSLQAITSGTANIGLGNFSGSGLTSGDNNIFIGSLTTPNVSNTGSNQLNIGNWIYGDNGKIGLGTAKIPTNQLHISGTTNPVRFEGLQANTSTADKVMVVDANGVVKTNINKLVTISAAYTVGVNDNSIIITGGAPNAATITFPQASVSNGRTLIVVNYSIGNQTLRSYDGVATELVVSVTTVAGVSSYDMINAQTGDFYGKATFQCDGNKWYMVTGATN